MAVGIGAVIAVIGVLTLVVVLHDCTGLVDQIRGAVDRVICVGVVHSLLKLAHVVELVVLHAVGAVAVALEVKGGNSAVRFGDALFAELQAALLLGAEVHARRDAVGAHYLAEAVDRVAVGIEKVCVGLAVLVETLELRKKRFVIIGKRYVGAVIRNTLVVEIVPYNVAAESLILRRECGEPSGMRRAVDAEIRGVIVILPSRNRRIRIAELDPACGHASVLIKGIACAVDRRFLVSAGIAFCHLAVILEVIPVGAVIDDRARIVGIIDIHILAGLKVLPHAGDAVSVTRIAVVPIAAAILDPSGLHIAVIVEIVVNAVDLLGLLADQLAVGIKVIPLAVDLSPGGGHHPAVGVHIAFIIDEAVCCHNAGAVKVVVAAVRTRTPVIGHLITVLVIHPLVIFLCPSVSKCCRGKGKYRSCR